MNIFIMCTKIWYTRLSILDMSNTHEITMYGSRQSTFAFLNRQKNIFENFRLRKKVIQIRENIQGKSINAVGFLSPRIGIFCGMRFFTKKSTVMIRV